MLGGADGAAATPSARRRSRKPTRPSRALETSFFATPYRPTGLSTSTRAVVRLVDELRWLNAVVLALVSAARSRRRRDHASARSRRRRRRARARRRPARERRRIPGKALDAALDATARSAARARARDDHAAARDSPTDRAPPISVAGPELPRAGAELRRRADRDQHRVRGRRGAARPDRRGCSAGSRRDSRGRCRRRASAPRSHVSRQSLWLRNSIRGAAGLGVAVLVADLSGVQHCVLGRVRDPGGAALERAEHRPEHRPGAAGHGRRVHRRRRFS